MKNVTRRNITPNDLRASERLRALWARKRRELQLTQESAAARLDITQGAFNQYLHGRIALNPRMVFLMAKLLQVHPSEIRDDFDFTPASHFSNDAESLAAELMRQPPQIREEVREYMRWLIEREAGKTPRNTKNGNDQTEGKKS